MGKKKQGCILSWLLGAGACTPSHGAGEVAAPPTDCGDGGVFSLVFFLVSGCGIGNAGFGSTDCYWLSRMSISSIRWKSVRGRMNASLLLFQLLNDL